MPTKSLRLPVLEADGLATACAVSPVRGSGLSGHVVVVASGGLASTVLAYLTRADGADRLTVLSVGIGPRDRIGHEYLALTATALGAEHVTLPRAELEALLQDASRVVSGSSHLVGSEPPNIDGLVLELAIAYGVVVGADAVAIATHCPDGEHGQAAASFGFYGRLVAGGLRAGGFHLVAPFLLCGKAAVVRIGAELGVPFIETWSCDVGGDWHCGGCAGCERRRSAFAVAEVTDPTCYRFPVQADPAARAVAAAALRVGTR